MNRTIQQSTGLLLFVAFLLFCPSLFGQNRDYVNWKIFRDSTYVFEITNKEAEKFLKKGGSEKLMSELLHTQVATFLNKWENAPTQGHFIYANIRQNKIDYRYAPIMPFQVFLFKEYGLLTLQVLDADGEIREDAKVKIQGGWWRIFDNSITYDKTSKTYWVDDWSESPERILTVELDKFKAVFDLEKHIVNPWYGGNSNYSESRPSFYSYMLTDKNKYKPNEKVRFKSYALSGNKKPIKKDLEVWMQSGNGGYSFKKISTLSPYHAGGFAGEINLHDSLQLKLDKNYGIQLRDNKGQVVSNGNIRYEDYELYDNKMETKVKDFVHYFPDTNRVEIKVIDANGLIMKDMKSVITINRIGVSRSYVELLVSPNFVLCDTIQLANDKTTVYDIPPQLFDKTDCNYSISIKTLTPDGQLLIAQHNVAFFKSYYAIRQETEGNAIKFDFYELGKEKSVNAKLYIDNLKEPTDIVLPHLEPFKQSVESYRVVVPQYNTETQVYTQNIYHQLNIEGGIVKDSLKIKLENPLALDVSWYLYEGNLLLEKGFGKKFAYEQAYIDLNTTYYLEIFYTVGGEDQVYRKIYVPKKEYLSINLDMPSKIYPGQTVDSKVTVLDSRGKGVKDVDVTAFSYNSLLGYHVPDLPYYGNTPQGREQRDSYSINERSVSYSSVLTQNNYNFWNRIMKLDEMDYYKFAFPDPALHDSLVFSHSQVTSYANIPYHDTFKYTIDTPEGTTEFAPYVMQDGKEVQIYAIELDNQPVYFSWTEQPKSYSFLTESNYSHNIMLRLHDRAIIIDQYCFDKGKKTILSINLNKMPKSKYIKTVWLDTLDKYGNYHLTEKERERYNKLVAEIPVPDNRYIYMKQGDVKYPVFHPKIRSYKPKVLVGPLNEGYYQYMDSTKYYHEGGFSYKYNDNVVYKYPANNYPQSLWYLADNRFNTLNDFYLTPSEFQNKIGVVLSEDKWLPTTINLENTKIHTPVDKDQSGVHSLVMRSRETGKLFLPAFKRNISSSHGYGAQKDMLYGLDKMKYGNYDIFLVYNNGEYLRYDSVPLLQNTYTELKMDSCIVHPKDSVSMKWLEYQVYGDNYSYSGGSYSGGSYSVGSYSGTSKPQNRNYSDSYSYAIRTTFNPGNDVQGTIVDEFGEPLIGVSINLKGTSQGTMTDLDGKFILDLHGLNNTLRLSYIGYKSKEIEVTRGSSIDIVMEPDQMSLDEVVVVAYGTQRRQSVTGSVSSISVSSLAGSAPQEDVEESEDQSDNTNAEAEIYQELLQLDGMRTNFSDVGFWQPALVTNRKGEAEFTVTFPDNITQWEAVVYAMNRKLKTGTLRKSIKSYKPLMAELKTPQFLVVGDSSYFAANIRNYTNDKQIEGKVNFVQSGDTLVSKAVVFQSSHVDKLLVEAQDTDSITASYRFTRNDGYSDGEQRSISIQKQGTKMAEGTLQFLRNGDEINIAAQSNEEVYISITGKQLDIYMDAANYLQGYEYACNEQLASKLIGILNYKLYQQFNRKQFKNDKEVNEIIKRLLDNQNNMKLWSWWGNYSNTSYWMSAHILRALRLAKEAGYVVNLDIKKIEYDYMDIHRFRHSSLQDIDILSALVDWGTEQNYAEAITMFEKQIASIEAREDSLVKVYKKTKLYVNYAVRNSYLREKLVLQEMRQKLGLGYDRTLITSHLKKDVLGSVRIADPLQNNRYWYYNNDATNIVAYRIIKRDSTLTQHVDGMQMYILGTKQYGWNTYQASSAIVAILPDLLAESASKDSLAKVKLSGSDNKLLTDFPFTTILNAGQQLNIKKESGIPLIYSAYTIKRRTEETFGEAFEVRTWLSNNKLEKGVPVTMEVEVRVKQENAEHVMIEVPIPAGCSYYTKYRGYDNEVHREYFKEKVSIFCEKLPEGTYKYKIELLPRYTGSYTLNPAKVEMMYFPVVNANNEMKRVRIDGE